MTTIYGDLVDINGFIFNTDTPLFYDFRIDSLAGWNDGPELDVVISEYGVADGGTPGFFPAKSKFVTIEGYVPCGNRDGIEQVQTILGMAFPRNIDIVIKRYSPVSKQMTVRRAGKIEYIHDEDGFEDALRFLVPVVATDPFRYSTDETVITTGISTPDESGRIYPRVYPMIYTPIAGDDTGNLGVTFTNEGNVNSYPVTYVNGPLDAGGWQIANDTTGQRLTFNLTLAAGQQLRIDHGNHVLQLNGYPAVYRAEGEWWPLVPGDNFVRLTSSVFNATASMEVHARSAWE